MNSRRFIVAIIDHLVGTAGKATFFWGGILKLRRDADLAREIAARFTEGNAEMLRRRGLPVTPGTLYLAHFAGGAGAVAILLADEQADAASRQAQTQAAEQPARSSSGPIRSLNA
jgi:hypothetical protein